MALARPRRAALLALMGAALVVGAVACSDGTRGGPATTTETVTTGDLGGYLPASDVVATAALSRDVARIGALLGADRPAAAIERVYAEGGAAGPERALRHLATTRRDEPFWTDFAAFYEDPAWLDTFVTQALTGSGSFAGASDEVRRRAVRAGIRDGVMVALVLHELVAAEARVAAGETGAADGAPHDVDEAWATYRGDEPAGAPFSTAARLGAAFGAGDAVNRAIRAEMTAARAAAGAGDAGALKAADDEIVRQILITYLRAALRSSAASEAALAAGDAAAARAEQAEGLARYRVIAPLVAGVDEAAARRALDAFDITKGPSRGMGRVVTRALRSTYEGLGIERAEIGTPGG